MRALVTLAVLALVGALVALDQSALCLVPALALLAPLLLRRYPGERTLAKLVCVRRGRRRLRIRSTVPCKAASLAVFVPRGGLLLACSLAVRPPPALGWVGSKPGS